MSHHSIQRLTECDLMLAHITTRYGTTIRQLHQALPGYPARTPGSGEPGGGKGYVAGSSTERLAGLRDPALDDLHTALTLPSKISAAVNQCAIGATITIRNVPNGPRQTLRQLVWTRWIIRQLIEQQHPVTNTKLATLHRHCRHLEQLTQRWPPSSTPKTTATNQLADDPTELWCRNCLNIGAREPRWRGDLDRWCYEFKNAEGFLPPAELLKIRQSKPRVTQRDVEKFIRAHREATKKRRKKAG